MNFYHSKKLLTHKRSAIKINFFTVKALPTPLLLHILKWIVNRNIQRILIFSSQSSTVCTWELASTVLPSDFVSSGPTCVSFFLVATSPVDRISVGWGLRQLARGTGLTIHHYSPLSLLNQSLFIVHLTQPSPGKICYAEWFTENCLHISTMSNMKPHEKFLSFHFILIVQVRSRSSSNSKT